MSTDYYRVCQRCLDEVKHYHIRSDTPVVHTWYGGIEKGMQVAIDWDSEDALLTQWGDSVQLLSENQTEGELQTLVTVGELRTNIGAGKK